jgi:hypothetical protein
MCFGSLEATIGDALTSRKTFSTAPAGMTAISAPAADIVLPPNVLDQAIDLCDIQVLKVLLLECSQPILIRLGATTNSPITVTAFILLITDVTSSPTPNLPDQIIYLSNPNGTSTTVRYTATGI